MAGEWQKAHVAVQPYADKLSCLIHAYLHRQEGDLDNAGYWYRRAGETYPENSMQQEMLRLQELLK